MQFDPNTASFEGDPYRLYRRLRDERPVYCHEGGARPLWVLSRFTDVSAALEDWQTYTSVGSTSSALDIPQLDGSLDRPQLITTDPPLHDELRSVVREHFSPKRVQALEPRISEVVDRCLAGLDERQTLDVARDFAWRLTLAIISELIGIPESDRPTVLSWYQELEYAEAKARSSQTLQRYTDYFDELAAERLAHPRDDLMSQLVQAVADGDIARPDALVLCRDLFEGGVDVPANLMGNAVLALAGRPDQRAYLADGELDMTRIRLSVEELARFDCPIQSIPRITTTSVSRQDVEIPSGATVILLLGSANRDERQFADPDVLDLTAPRRRNLAFGGGVHFCIGAPLARLEASLALPRLLRAIGDYELVAPVERPRGDPVMRAVLSLDVTVAA
jgi:cytochrome P450